MIRVSDEEFDTLRTVASHVLDFITLVDGRTQRHRAAAGSQSSPYSPDTQSFVEAVRPHVETIDKIHRLASGDKVHQRRARSRTVKRAGKEAATGKRAAAAGGK